MHRPEGYRIVGTSHRLAPAGFIKTPDKTTGIVSTRPNQFLHVDTTFYILADGIKTSITFVSDNFSRMILGWSISTKNTANNVKNALRVAIQTIHKHYPQQISATLVADGGSENHAVTIEKLLAQTPNPEITKIIALKDITFSNSPIEAIHKIMKRYMRYYNPKNIAELSAIIIHAVEDYTINRPHLALNGYTPMEVYTQKLPPMDYTLQIAQAKQNRLELNRNINCSNC